MEPTETYKAWLAGFFDGEGTVCVVHQKRHDRYVPRVVLYQKNQLNLLLEIRDFYGGAIRFLRSGFSDGLHGLFLDNKGEMKRFLQDVIPYLRVKRAKAELVLAICSLDIGKNQKGFAEEKALRREYVEQLRSIQ